MRRTEYESIRSKLPLKIIVGFKGVGKSAALKVSFQEDQDQGIAAIWVRPDDVSELYSDLINERNPLKPTYTMEERPSEANSIKNRKRLDSRFP